MQDVLVRPANKQMIAAQRPSAGSNKAHCNCVGATLKLQADAKIMQMLSLGHANRPLQ